MTDDASRRSALALAATAASLGSTVAVAAFVALRLVGSERLPWPAASLLAFTPYALIVASFVLIADLVLRRWTQAAVAGAALIALVAIVTPRMVARDQPAVPRDATTVRVMTANVFRDGADPRAVIRLVKLRRPDILSLQEATPGYLRRLRRAGIDAILPNGEGHEGGRWKDTSVLSRWTVVRRKEPPMSSVLFATTIAVPGQAPLPFVSAHPSPPVTPARQALWERWLAAIPPPNAELAGGIVAGDFNATLDHAQLQRVMSDGWRDAAREVGAGLDPSWHGRRGARLTLDHVLVAPGIAVRDSTVDDLPGSDHRAITVTVQLPG